MADLDYSSFAFPSGRPVECITPAAEPAKDPCKVEVEEAEKNTNFTLERKGRAFHVAAADAAQVNRAYPSYRPPMRELSDFILLQSEFFKVFGDSVQPSDTANTITIISPKSGRKEKAVFPYINILINFISHGKINSSNSKMKEMLEQVITIAAYSFADPTMGTLVVKILKNLQDNTQLGSESKKRIEWLLGIYDVREKFWSQMKPEMDKSTTLSTNIPPAAVDMMVFLFATHILSGRGFESTLFSPNVLGAAQSYHDVVSKIDSNYTPDHNFYDYMRGILPKLRSANVPEQYRKDFTRRLEVIDAEYEKAAQKETMRLLPQTAPMVALRVYFKVKYGDTPKRKEAMEIILKHVKIQVKDGDPNFVIPMAGIAGELKDWASTQPSKKEKAEATEAILFILKALFERDEYMEVYWDKKVQTMPNFYTSANIPLIGTNKSYLEGLIRWARGEAANQGINVPSEEKPHVALRKWTAATELGVGALGFGTFAAMGAMEDSDGKYYGRGGAVIVGGTGLGAALGNGASYVLDVDGGNEMWFDIGGGILGGTIAGLIYFQTTSKPGGGNNNQTTCVANQPGNCKFGTDEYGQSFRGSPWGFSTAGHF